MLANITILHQMSSVTGKSSSIKCGHTCFSLNCAIIIFRGPQWHQYPIFVKHACQRWAQTVSKRHISKLFGNMHARSLTIAPTQIYKQIQVCTHACLHLIYLQKTVCQWHENFVTLFQKTSWETPPCCYICAHEKGLFDRKRHLCCYFCSAVL